MLVSSLAGRENILNAYKIAVEEKYRFFSFGDAMFIKQLITDIKNFYISFILLTKLFIFI